MSETVITEQETIKRLEAKIENFTSESRIDDARRLEKWEKMIDECTTTIVKLRDMGEAQVIFEICKVLIFAGIFLTLLFKF